jgi:hypothetical protein
VIILPLLVIFQQSLSQGKFPSSWKKAKVVPVYKGKGERSLPSAYRPISLCSCVGKLLEKVVAVQLMKHIDVVKPLSVCQFGFQRGRSTVANLLACNASLKDTWMKANHLISFLLISSVPLIRYHTVSCWRR